MTPSMRSQHQNALPGPENITRVELQNGITILARRKLQQPPRFPSKVNLPSGSLFDPEDKLGLSYLTASSLMTGTAHDDFQSLYNKIESVGAQLGFSAGTLTTSFSVHCLSEDLDLMLGADRGLACGLRLSPERELTG